MSDRRNIPVRVCTFSEEDQERLLEETILEWRALGPAAAWDAIYDILGCWFAARGLDPEAQRVDRTHIEIRPVPWLTAGSPSNLMRSAPREGYLVPEPLSSDRKELLDALNRWRAEYLVIGGHAVGVYAEPRGTKDLEIWINPTKRNARRVLAALKEFGAPLFGTTETTITDKEDFLVIGVAPNRIDILKSISGLKFPACWKNRRTFDLHGTTAHFLNLQDLLTAKLAAGRPQDLADAAKLMKTLELDRRQQETSEPSPASPGFKSSPSKPRGRRQGKKRDGENEHGPESER